MTRALVTQMLEALENAHSTHSKWSVGYKAITAAREYLATEPSGERAELIEELRSRVVGDPFPLMDRAADMLEAEAQPKDKGPWCAGVTSKDARVYVQSDDFKHDVRLYVTGDFATVDEKYLYACEVARQLTAAAETMTADAKQAKRVPMTEKQIDKIHANTARLAQRNTTFFIAFARALESHHKINAPK